jgi:hypothetical protein
MTRTFEELEATIRERICRVCTDRTVEGKCGLEDPTSCALFRLFPEVARAVQSVSSDDIRDYIRAIREQVCSVCSERTSEGECESRKQVQCALDAYLLLIVDAIEEATGKSFDRNEAVISPNLVRPEWVISPQSMHQAS